MKNIDKFELERNMIRNRDLTDGEIAVYWILLSFYNPKLGYSYPPQNLLIEILNYGSMSTLRKKIKGLEKKGYITIKRTWQNNRYYFNNPIKDNHSKKKPFVEEELFDDDGFPLFDID